MIYYYIKSFLRSIRKNFFFHSINLTGFFAGIFLLTILFTFIDQEFSFDRFHKNRASIYRIHSGGYGVTPLCFGEQIKNRIPEVEKIVRFNLKELILVLNEKEFDIKEAYYVDPEILEVFSFRIKNGNAARALDAPFSIVISQSVSERLFGDRSALGETVQDKDGSVYTITGIMEDLPYTSHIRANAFIPIETLRRTQGEEAFNCGNWNNLTYLQLTEHVDIKETERKLNALLEDSRMETSDGKLVLQLEPITKIYFDSVNNKFDGSIHGNLQTVVLYSAIALLILLIVMINYINLSVAISGSRLKQISVQKISGATNSGIIRQFAMESCGIAWISFLISWLMIELLLPRISHMLNLSISASFSRFPLYGYLSAGILCVGAIAGFLPGRYITRINLVRSLKNESVFTSRGIQRKVLLVIQLTIVSLMLNSTSVINRQIHFILKKDMGFRQENIVSFYLDKTLKDKHELFKQALLQNPALKAVSFSDGFMGDGLTKRPVNLDNVEKLCNFLSIDPEYIGLYSIRLKYGRNFSRELGTDRQVGYLFNEAACRSFGIEDPVGKMIRDKMIVGVVYDFNFSTLHNQIEPLIMTWEEGNAIQIKIANENQQETINFINAAYGNISPGTKSNLTFLDKRIKKLYKPELDLKSSFRVYSFITFFIALLGLFGLTLFQARKMTKELSLRKIYGAGLLDTLGRFAREYIPIIMTSNAIAVPISLWFMNKWLAHFQYKAELGPIIFIKTLILTSFFTLLAVSFLIFRTQKTDPLKTLKQE